EGVATHQQRMKGESLAQMLVLDEARYHAVHTAPGLQLGQLRTGSDHIANGQERHSAELDVPFLEDRPGVGQELAVAFDVPRVTLPYLPLQRRLVIEVIEGRRIFPAEPVEGRNR